MKNLRPAATWEGLYNVPGGLLATAGVKPVTLDEHAEVENALNELIEKHTSSLLKDRERPEFLGKIAGARAFASDRTAFIDWNCKVIACDEEFVFMIQSEFLSQFPNWRVGVCGTGPETASIIYPDAVVLPDAYQHLSPADGLLRLHADLTAASWAEIGCPERQLFFIDDVLARRLWQQDVPVQHVVAFDHYPRTFDEISIWLACSGEPDSAIKILRPKDYFVSSIYELTENFRLGPPAHYGRPKPWYIRQFTMRADALPCTLTARHSPTNVEFQFTIDSKDLVTDALLRERYPRMPNF